MKQVCGTCNFQINSRSNKGCIEICCAHDNQWRNQKTPDCGKWAEYIPHLSPKDRLFIAESERKEIHDLESNELARVANEIAKSANRIASKAFSFTKRSSRIDRIIAIIAIIIAIIAARADIKWLITSVINIFKTP